MTLLEVTDLTVEYSSGGYKVRPLDDFTLHVDKRRAHRASRGERLWQVDAVVCNRRDSAAGFRIDPSWRWRSRWSGEQGAHSLSSNVGRRRVPSLQPHPLVECP